MDEEGRAKEEKREPKEIGKSPENLKQGKEVEESAQSKKKLKKDEKDMGMTEIEMQRESYYMELEKIPQIQQFYEVDLKSLEKRFMTINKNVSQIWLTIRVTESEAHVSLTLDNLIPSKVQKYELLLLSSDLQELRYFSKKKQFLLKGLETTRSYQVQARIIYENGVISNWTKKGKYKIEPFSSKKK